MGKQWAAQWKVNSFRTDKIYTVSVAKTGRWACDCPAHRFARAPKPACKHILKVRGVQELTKGASTVYTGPSVTTKVTGGEIVVCTPTMLVIQTRREICLEED